MELTGRITGNAKVTTLKDERQVVNFTIALNDFYKPKGSSEGKQLATFYQCAYWQNPKLAQYLTKGSLVEVSGRVYATAYMSGNNEAKASLHLHVNMIKLHGKSTGTKAEVVETAVVETLKDDLPF